MLLGGRRGLAPTVLLSLTLHAEDVGIPAPDQTHGHRARPGMPRMLLRMLTAATQRCPSIGQSRNGENAAS